MTGLYNFLAVNNKYAVSAYKVQRRIKGLYCKIYKPAKATSIFGQNGLVEYEEDYIEEKFLVFNLFQESESGGLDFAPFLTDPYILTLYEEKLPLRAKVEVDFYGRKYFFTVDTHRSFTPHVEQQLFIGNMLVALT